MRSSTYQKPLSSLITLAIRKYGDSAGSSLYAGDTDVFLFYANDVVRDINYNPYTDGEEDIEFYNHEQERRPIESSVLVKGLVFYYSLDQNSKRAPIYRAEYYQALNQWLYRRKFGDGPIQSQKFDDENSG